MIIYKPLQLVYLHLIWFMVHAPMNCGIGITEYSVCVIDPSTHKRPILAISQQLVLSHMKKWCSKLAGYLTSCIVCWLFCWCILEKLHIGLLTKHWTRWSRVLQVLGCNVQTRFLKESTWFSVCIWLPLFNCTFLDGLSSKQQLRQETSGGWCKLHNCEQYQAFSYLVFY